MLLVIAYGKGVVMCEQFLWKYNGGSYSKFVRKYSSYFCWKPITAKAIFLKGNFFWNGDPVQNWKELHKAYNKICGTIVPIPSGSPEINPVENIFNNVRSKLRTDAWEQKIKYDSYEKWIFQLLSIFVQKLSTEL